MLTTKERAEKMFDEMTAKLKENHDRSAWGRAVNTYALELVESAKENAAWIEQLPQTTLELEKLLLNGADNWEDFSYGGSSLVCDFDIAERVCTPSELKKRKGGERRPNSREEWLDVQARALHRAGKS